MTITEFLLARIDEDEDAARMALQSGIYPHFGDDAAEETLEMADSEGVAAEGPAHFKRWMPGRALAECKAKRTIIEMHPARWQEVELGRKMCEEEAKVERVAGPFYDDELRALAAVYAEHPDYDATWRLTT